MKTMYFTIEPIEVLDFKHATAIEKNLNVNIRHLINVKLVKVLHCVKSVHIRTFSGPNFPAFGLKTEIYSLNLRIQPECGKIRSEKLGIQTLFTQCYT